MFSGIIETTALVLDAQKDRANVRIDVKKPNDFNDINVGDSIAHDGVCLTVESFDDAKITYILAAETLQITKWSEENLKGHAMNVERSMKMSDRIHGHLVTGHVDCRLKVLESKDLGGSLIIRFELNPGVQGLVWSKGSVCLNGVSLTVNDVEGDWFEVCLIPETLRRTNLGELKPGDEVNFEADQIARALRRMIELGELKNIK